MPIKGILNGYYRSGTTILWWIFQLSNLETPIIYEPHSPAVYEELKKASFWTINKLHNLPIYLPYFIVRDDIRALYLAKAKPKPIYFEPKEAIETIEMFESAIRPIIIQSNQLRPVLKDVAEHFDCNYVHVVRNPAETFWSHLPPELRNEKAIAEISKGYHIGKLAGAFWIIDIYEEVKKRFRLKTKPRDIMGMFAIAWSVTNYLVIEQWEETDKCFVVRFEDLVENKPKSWNIVAEHLGLNLNKAYTHLLSKDRAYNAPDILKRELAIRFIKYGLTEVLETIGYRKIFE